MNLNDPLNGTELSALFSVHRTTIDNWIKEGLPVEKGGPAGNVLQVPLKVAVQWARDRDLAKHKAALAQLRQESDGEETAKARKLAADARMRELDLAEREAKLVDVAQVEDAWQQQVAAVREALMTLAAEAVQAGLVQPQDEGKVEDMVRERLVNAAAKIREGEHEA